MEQEQFSTLAQLEHNLLGSAEEADGEATDDSEFIASAQNKPEPKKAPQKPSTFDINSKSPHTVTQAAKGKSKREHSPFVDVEREDMQFGQPTKQIKRSQPSPPGRSLALPSSSTTAPPLSFSVVPRTIVDQNNAVFPSPGSANLSESEDEWDDAMQSVLGGTRHEETDGSTPGNDVLTGEADEDAGEEIDENLFAAELDRELAGDEDGEEDVEAGSVANLSQMRAALPGRPISLNQFAGGQVEPDDDDYTSSEDSDDD